ncbi:MAG: radical SAM protein [Candidatus Hodarchaeota archaeon]
MTAVAHLSQAYLPYIVLKVSSRCNLACEYCQSTDLPRSRQMMPIKLISRILSDLVPNFQKQQYKHLQLVFHGGEPLLAGLEFYKRVLELESQLIKNDFLISNGIQTNGILITENWATLFKQGKFQVGISLDGPQAIHDKYRKDQLGKPTFSRIAQSIEILQENKMRFGLLSVITEESPSYCAQFFDLLTEWNISSFNFLPFRGSTTWKHVQAYSTFAKEMFDLWLDHDMPFYVLTFLEILRKIGDQQTNFCEMTSNCGKMLAIDSLGRIFPCDRFMNDERFQIGTVSPSSFELAENPPKIPRQELSSSCSECEVRDICFGGCPTLADPQTGKNVYCFARKELIQHINRCLEEQELFPDKILQRFDRKTIQWVDAISL